MAIRMANKADVNKIYTLVKSLSHFYLNNRDGSLPNWFSETLTEQAFIQRVNNERYHNFVYIIDDQIVGYLAFRGNSHLYHLFVSERHQGQGIAKKLWQHATQYCIAECYTLRSSLFAIPVYKKFGFKKSGAAGEKDGIGFQPMEKLMSSSY